MKGVFVDGTWYQFQGIPIEGIPPVDYCHPPKIEKPLITNADRIRAMTDEELEQFLNVNVLGEIRGTWKNWHDWLKQEAGE